MRANEIPVLVKAKLGTKVGLFPGAVDLVHSFTNNPSWNIPEVINVRELRKQHSLYGNSKNLLWRAKYTAK